MHIFTPKQAEDVRVLILSLLNEQERRPAELLGQLQSREVSEAQIKDELAALIDDQIVEFSPDRHIRLRAGNTTTVESI